MGTHRLNDDDSRVTSASSLERAIIESFKDIQLKPSEEFYKSMQRSPWHQHPKGAGLTNKTSTMARLSSVGFVAAVLATILIVAVLIAFTPIGVYAKGLIDFLLRAESDQITVTITVPAQYPSTGYKSLETARLSTEEAQILAGFNVLTPNAIPEDFNFIGANYDERLGSIELYYADQNGWFVITQKKGVIDFQRIGASATIHLIPIGDIVGEYVPGGWSVVADDGYTFNKAVPGTEVALNAVWDSQLQQNMLRWKNGDILIEILSFSDQLDVEALIIIAESIHITP